jgi:hypothetical protein
VYFEAPPPRNPAVPVGYDPQKQENRGFQGSPAIASFYKGLATKDSGRWHYDDKAAAAVSSASLSWMLTLPCEAWDTMRCIDGQIEVRVGGTDAVHLDREGCGAIRFALGLEEGALRTAPPDPKSVTAAVTKVRRLSVDREYPRTRSPPRKPNPGRVLIRAVHPMGSTTKT